jgi:hypothetical protein
MRLDYRPELVGHQWPCHGMVLHDQPDLSPRLSSAVGPLVQEVLLDALMGLVHRSSGMASMEAELRGSRTGVLSMLLLMDLVAR